MSEERVKIKICGLSRPEDIAFVNEAGPDFCGFVINVPKSRRNTTPDQVRAMVRELSADVIPVGVFRNEPVEQVAELLADGTIAIAQLHGNEDEDYIRRLKALGDFPVIQAFNEKTIFRAENSSADYILLDHGAGGTGETFSWELTRQIDRPFFLAGGLGPHNVADAIAQTHPWAVDMSSSVEVNGYKDRDAILAAVQAVRTANK